MSTNSTYVGRSHGHTFEESSRISSQEACLFRISENRLNMFSAFSEMDWQRLRRWDLVK